jgi:hypothetical protein
MASDSRKQLFCVMVEWKNIYLSVILNKVYQIWTLIVTMNLMTALRDVVNDDSDEDDIIQGFVWEDINKYKGQGENFTSSVRPQDAAKVMDDFQLFFNRELIDRIAEETDMLSSFYMVVNYRADQPLGHGNL